jgi:hypothetical protein
MLAAKRSAIRTAVVSLENILTRKPWHDAGKNSCEKNARVSTWEGLLSTGGLER